MIYKKINNKYLFNIISKENYLIIAYITILSRDEILEWITIKRFDDLKKLSIIINMIYFNEICCGHPLNIYS